MYWVAVGAVSTEIKSATSSTVSGMRDIDKAVEVVVVVVV
eukprot:CAMPEP_0168794872 /NCGR_PEP_ID=MMETSP0725-20121227/15875_1 /TAXON_ID=265536 /ORGANISM="Amphiprora sp., Strain CCMP467" /LENGTH=39 /DNA_ID= /DNA_START= /DNA_END= /DNA_ORIENTATION=